MTEQQPSTGRYILIETLVATVLNVALSIAFALPVAWGVSAVPLWGASGMAVDLIPTVFMITLANTIVITLLTRSRIRAGRVAPVTREEAGYLGFAPYPVYLRAPLYALLAAIVIVPLTIGALILLDVQALSFTAFVLFKSVYGAVLSVLLMPPIIRAALLRFEATASLSTR